MSVYFTSYKSVEIRGSQKKHILYQVKEQFPVYQVADLLDMWYFVFFYFDKLYCFFSPFSLFVFFYFLFFFCFASASSSNLLRKWEADVSIYVNHRFHERIEHLDIFFCEFYI